MTFQLYENLPWLGSYYEICICLGPAGDDQRYIQAIQALWSHPSLERTWQDSEADPYEIQVEQFDTSMVNRGILTLADQKLGCLTSMVREEWEPNTDQDWLSLSVPTGMSDRFDVPLSESAWLTSLNEIFYDIGAHLYERVKYSYAVIGEEVSGYELTDPNIHHIDRLAPLEMLESDPMLQSARELRGGLMLIEAQSLWS